ncbi:MAG: SWIM zinc finger family protein [Candidatus Hydrogenedentes bacterium]|nr:SWIM zinc finger family protein [Candidatus Hydrogenedentota bacterium]
MPVKRQGTRKQGGSKTKSAAKKVSRTRKPDNMSVEYTQIALRREYGRSQSFSLKNVGDHPVFSDFQVTNPATDRTYRVAIRGSKPGENFCSCPDFTVNTLGTCRHVEFVLGKLEKKRGAKLAFRDGCRPSYSSVYLRYGAQRAGRRGTAERTAAYANSSRGVSRNGPGGTSSITVAFRAKIAMRWCSGLSKTPRAACSWPPTPAGWDLICSTLRWLSIWTSRGIPPCSNNASGAFTGLASGGTCRYFISSRKGPSSTAC